MTARSALVRFARRLGERLSRTGAGDLTIRPRSGLALGTTAGRSSRTSTQRPSAEDDALRNGLAGAP